MDIVNKAIAKASDLAGEAAWNAQQRIKVNTEEKRIQDLRNKALAKRAEIGEAMFRLWQAHKLPPSQLDGLFYELQDLLDAVDGATQNLDALKALFLPTAYCLLPTGWALTTRAYVLSWYQRMAIYRELSQHIEGRT